MRSIALGLALCALASNMALAQTAALKPKFGTAYSGAIYVTPQDSAFSAPGLYRSAGSVATDAEEMTVSSICTRDFRETKALNTLYRGQSSASGLSVNAPKTFGLSLTGLNLKVVEVGGKYADTDSAKITTGTLRVYSGDDTVVDDVLSAIGPKCRELILLHLKNGRAVFVAGKAIQSKDFNVTFEKGRSGGITIKCLIPIFCPNFGADFNRQRTETRSSADYVTFMLVPAEVSGNRVFLTRKDIGR